MNKKIIGIIAFAIIIIGIVVTVVLGIDSDLVYKAHKELDVSIGKEFDNKEIESIVKEVVEGKEVIVSKVELYEDMANIKIEDITDEQIEQINSKINEKFSTDNKVDDIIITEVPKANTIDFLKPYIVPTIIALVIIEIYLVIYLIIYKKTNKENVEVNIPKSMLELFASVVVILLIFLSVAIFTKFPINGFVIPGALLLFVITTIAYFIKK
ncbi:MAG: hypothetical protein J6M60_04745 [Clostridia bacterium]|nr:hypothetical protein [Clostridia bacterium]